MLIISNEDKQFLIENIEDAEALINNGDLNAILLPLDRFITDYGFDVDIKTDDWQLNDIGRTAQRIYDRIYFNN